jgi:hypothetical protein
MIHKDLFRRFLAGFYVLAFSTLLLGLTRYSYLAKEILVCWLLFCSFFAVLALIVFGAVLAAIAGQYFVELLRVAKLIIMELATALAANPQRAAAGIDSVSYLLSGPTPLSEKPFSERDVLN